MREPITSKHADHVAAVNADVLRDGAEDLAFAARLRGGTDVQRLGKVQRRAQPSRPGVPARRYHAWPAQRLARCSKAAHDPAGRRSARSSAAQRIPGRDQASFTNLRAYWLRCTTSSCTFEKAKFSWSGLSA